jgi:hypothetical protein
VPDDALFDVHSLAEVENPPTADDAGAEIPKSSNERACRCNRSSADTPMLIFSKPMLLPRHRENYLYKL